MNLLDVTRRALPPEPWAEGEKIPWEDPAFSERMLREHLSQEHDRASRRAETIAAQVAWIHRAVLGGRPVRVLDLGCGPGLYTARLAALGHTCVGIDVAPAAVAHARKTAREGHLRCIYRREDIRQADFDVGFGLVMLIFGELNVFRPGDAAAILRKARHALANDGILLLEAHTFAAVQAIGEAAPQWQTAEHGLFAARPHLLLTESFWDHDRRVATRRCYVVDAGTGEVTRHAESLQAYWDDEYRALLAECGLAVRGLYPSLTGKTESGSEFLVWVASKVDPPTASF